MYQQVANFARNLLLLLNDSGFGNLSVEEIAKAIAAGATLPPPASDTAKESFFNQAIAALKAGNQPEYDRLMSEHYKSTKP